MSVYVAVVGWYVVEGRVLVVFGLLMFISIVTLYATYKNGRPRSPSGPNARGASPGGPSNNSRRPKSGRRPKRNRRPKSASPNRSIVINKGRRMISLNLPDKAL